jgi:hypothetical protein
MTDFTIATTHQHQSPHINHNGKGPKRLSGEDNVVILFSLLGLIGSVLLFFLKCPSVMISIFLSAGITALVYRFLGGIRGVKFGIGALKLSGTLGALVGIAWWVDGRLDEAKRFHLPSDDVLVGEWEWDVVGPSASWDGHLDFNKRGSQLVFSGKEYSLEKVGQDARNVPLLDITNGTANIGEGNSLSLESDVQELSGYRRKFHWKSTAPFSLTPAFRGELRPQKPDDPNLESQPWGMLIYKKAEKRAD